MSHAVEIIAHRGYSAKAPENTLAALDAAVAAGADAVEFDLHTAACGTPVVFHDAMLSRTTNGVGPLRRRTLEQLKALDAGKWFSPDFAGQRIPSFSDALQNLEGRVPRIYAEVKGFRELEDLDRMVRLARDADMLDVVVFISMNWTLLDRMRGQEPTLAVGYVVDEEGKIDEAVQRATGDAASLVDFRADLLTADPSTAQRCVDHGIDMAVWTVDDAAEAARLLELGVRRITTNQVEALLAWKASL
ncbi:MAG TPA: glycerophosphodiester phosphodiesterase family protein [Longimicrobiales bacterium]|nr:glycerophosphodiester phosphodiesterase family protein [Longimicrobiales bacterium]